MQLINKFNKGIRFLLCVIDNFSKYAWVVSLKDKKGIAFVNAYLSILNDSKRKRNKIWINKEGQLYNTSMEEYEVQVLVLHFQCLQEL